MTGDVASLQNMGIKEKLGGKEKYSTQAAD